MTRPARPRVLGAMFLAIVLATAACSGATSAPKGTPIATSRPSVSATTAASLSPTVSPETGPGGLLTYGRFSPDGVHTFMSNTDGTGERPLLSRGAEGGRFSPNGRRIAISPPTPHEDLCVVNPDGSGYTCFASPDPTMTRGCSAAWSPDASRLACEGWDDGNAARKGIFTVRASDGGGLVRVTTNPFGGHDVPGDYSPDGRQIVFLRGGADGGEQLTLMIVNVDGSNAHALIDRKVGLTSRWSRDGKTILTEADGKLLLVSVAGGEITPLTFQAGFTVASRGAWSPDGEWIVFTRRFLGQEDIYIVRKDGSDLRQVTNTPTQDEEFGDWGVAAP